MVNVLWTRKLASIAAVLFLSSISTSYAQTLSPPLPPIHSFTDCKFDPSPQPEFKEIESCLQRDWQFQSVSLSVDGNRSVRHIAWKLWRFSTQDHTLYQLEQYAYNCSTGFMIKRSVRSYLDPNQADLPLEKASPEAWSNTLLEPKSRRNYCP